LEVRPPGAPTAAAQKSVEPRHSERDQGGEPHFEAMTTMKKIDVATIETAREADVAMKRNRRRRRAPKTIDEYIDGCAPHAQPILRRVRATIAKAAPDATETISYGMPAFKLRRI